MTIGELIVYWAIFGIICLIGLHAEARKERKKWHRRYNMRRGNYEALRQKR